MSILWIMEAEKYLGQKEVPGIGSNPFLHSMWLKLKGGAWFWKAYGEDDSKLPWCGAFIAFIMSLCGIAYPAKFAAAKEWLSWGTVVDAPSYGCIVIFSREGGGHIGIVVGITSDGRLMVLGGNQKDGVCVLPFNKERVAGYRLPPGYAASTLPLPVLSAAGVASSTNEA